MINKSKYTDVTSTMQVIAGVYVNPSLLDNDEYIFHEEDFTEDFHKVLFGAMYNLHKLGAENPTVESIEDYLSTLPSAYATYQTYKGAEILLQWSNNVQLSAFDYYYQRMKKMTLLRMYDNIGLNLSWLYDPDNVFDTKKKEAQENWLNDTPIDEIADIIDKRIDDIRLKYVDNEENDFFQAGEYAENLIQKWLENPDVGYPLYGPVVNTVTRGARLKKFYLRSAATGVGKSRSMIADACYVATNEIYDIYSQKWIKNNTQEPAIFITTEQEEDEVTSMCLAFLSAVPEDHILEGKYEENELERVQYAIKVLQNSPLYIKKLPDFSMKDIENAIKCGIREYDAHYIFFDYIHSSMKILGEVTSKTGVKGLREDNILFMMSIRLKDLCNQYGVFILTSTQLNAQYTTAQIYDQNLLRGAKAIADKIDVGMIMLQTSQEDIEAITPILSKYNYPIPNVKMSVYKNRRGRYKDVLLWMKADRGICRFETLFVTDYAYNVIDIEDTQIIIEDTEEENVELPWDV